MRNKVLNIDWKSIDGAAVKRRALKLIRNDDGMIECPINTCLHIGFKSDRGARKHVNTIHPWYLFFDKQPLIKRIELVSKGSIKRKSTTHNIPAYTLTEGMGKEFLDWLKTPCGGGKSNKQAIQSGRRAMKFLMSSVGDTEVDKHVSDEFIDCCLGSPAIVIRFFKVVTEEWKISSSAALNYMKSINDLMDWRKANGVSDDVLRSFTMSEVYIRRGKENLSKQKRVEYSRNLDLENLICRQSWASVEEMEKVIPYHAPRYKYVIDICKEGEPSPSISQLAFATRFIATFLFLRVKCTRPMTYQYITLDMVKDARSNGGYIDQTAFKTERQYAFDTLILSPEVLQIIESYISFVRPRLSPSCQYLLLTTNGKQYTAFGSAMSILVHQAIEKYVNPTRYRQIIESESADRLSTEEMEVISKDQKHSSYVARRIYQKKLSRDVAAQGKACMDKITGKERDQHTKEMADVFGDVPSTSSFLPEEIVENIESGAAAVVPTNNDCEIEEVLSILNVTALDPKEEDDAEEEGTPENDNKEESHDQSIDVNAAEEVSVQSASRSMRDKSADSGCQRRISTRDRMPNEDELSVEVKKEMAEFEVGRGKIQKRFCPEEDSVLKEGIKKYGLGRWSLMLKDKTLKFHPCRTRDSIRMRADTLGLSKKKKGSTSLSKKKENTTTCN